MTNIENLPMEQGSATPQDTAKPQKDVPPSSERVTSDQLLSLYQTLPDLAPQLKGWMTTLRKPTMPSPVILSGDVISSFVCWALFYSILVIGVGSFLSSVYYVWLVQNHYSVTFMPEDCGVMVQFVSEIWPKLQLSHTLLRNHHHESGLNGYLTTGMDFCEATFHAICVVIASIEPEITAVIPYSMIVLPLLLVVYLFNALTLNAAIMAFVLFNMIAFIDPNLNVVLIGFLISGTIASRLKSLCYASFPLNRAAHPHTEKEVARYVLKGSNKARRSVQVVANGFPILCVFFPLYLSYCLFPPHLGDSLMPYVNIIHPEKYPFLEGSVAMKLLFFVSGLGKYLQGARDLILTYSLQARLSALSLPFVASITSRQLFIGICAAIGDTWGSDFGQCLLSSRVVAPVFPFRTVKRGTQGGISIPGVVFSGLGGAFGGYLLSVTRIWQGVTDGISRDLVIIGTASGVMGSYLDSILGWYLQPAGCDIFGVVWDDRFSSLCVGLEYLDLIVSEHPDNVKTMVDRIEAYAQTKEPFPEVPHPIFEDKMVPLPEAVRYRLVQYGQILKPSTIVLDNHSVNFIAPLLAVLVINLFALK